MEKKNTEMLSTFVDVTDRERTQLLEILSTLEDKIRISAQPCNILYLIVCAFWLVHKCGFIALLSRKWSTERWLAVMITDLLALEVLRFHHGFASKGKRGRRGWENGPFSYLHPRYAICLRNKTFLCAFISWGHKHIN